MWGVGFLLVWLSGLAAKLGAPAPAVAVLALAVLSLALVSYNPSASALVADLAPDHLRGCICRSTPSAGRRGLLLAQ
jgi:hypothetical protein